MTATITDISTAELKRERDSRLETQAKVSTPISLPDFPDFCDLCIGKVGIIKNIKHVEEGEHKGKWLYTMRFDTPRGYIAQSYLEEELEFPPFSTK